MFGDVLFKIVYYCTVVTKASSREIVSSFVVFCRSDRRLDPEEAAETVRRAVCRATTNFPVRLLSYTYFLPPWLLATHNISTCGTSLVWGVLSNHTHDTGQTARLHSRPPLCMGSGVEKQNVCASESESESEDHEEKRALKLKGKRGKKTFATLPCSAELLPARRIVASF